MMLGHFVVSDSDQQMPMRMWKLAFVFARAERHLVPLRCRLHAEALLSWASLFFATDAVDVEMLAEKTLRRTQLVEKDRRETMVSLRLVRVRRSLSVAGQSSTLLSHVAAGHFCQGLASDFAKNSSKQQLYLCSHSLIQYSAPLHAPLFRATR